MPYDVLAILPWETAFLVNSWLGKQLARLGKLFQEVSGLGTAHRCLGQLSRSKQMGHFGVTNRLEIEIPQIINT